MLWFGRNERAHMTGRIDDFGERLLSWSILLMVPPYYKVWWVGVDRRHTLNLPEVLFGARGKVLLMEEHSPSQPPPCQGKPAKLPIVSCERTLSHLCVWLEYGLGVE